jgi:hypothetical protein
MKTEFDFTVRPHEIPKYAYDNVRKRSAAKHTISFDPDTLV